MNPGFSSTKGVHISLAQFKEITYVRNSASISLSSTPVGLTSNHSRYHLTSVLRLFHAITTWTCTPNLLSRYIRRCY